MSDIHDAAQTEPTPTPPERRNSVRGPLVVLLAVLGGSFAGAQLLSRFPAAQTDPVADSPKEAANTVPAVDTAAVFGEVSQDQFQQEPAHDTAGLGDVSAYYGTTFNAEPVAQSPPQQFGSTPAPAAATSPNSWAAAEFDAEQRRFQKQIQRLKSRVDQLEARLWQRASQRDQIIRAKGQQPARRSSDRFDNSFGDVRDLPAPAMQNPPAYDRPARQPPSRATNADPRNLMPGAQSGFDVEGLFQGQQDFAPEPANSYPAAQARSNTAPDRPNIPDLDPGFRPSTPNFDRVRQPEQFQPARNIPPRINDSIESTDNFNPRSSFGAKDTQPPLLDESPATRAAPLDSDTAPAARPNDPVRPIDQFVPRPDSPALQSDGFDSGVEPLKDIPEPRPSPARSDMNSPMEDLAPREVEPTDDFNLEPDIGSDEAIPLPRSSSDLGFNSDTQTVPPPETSEDLLLQEPIPMPNGFSQPPAGNGTRQPADSLGSILCQRFQTTKSKIAALSVKQNLTDDEKEALQFLREELFVISEQVRSQKVLVRRRWTQAQQRHRNLAIALASLQQNGVNAPATTPIEDKIQSVLAEERQLKKLTVEMEASDVVTLAQLVSDTPVQITFNEIAFEDALDWFAEKGNLTFDVRAKLPQEAVTEGSDLGPKPLASALTEFLGTVNLRQYVERDPAGRLKIVITDAPASNGLNSDSWNPDSWNPTNQREAGRPASDDNLEPEIAPVPSTKELPSPAPPSDEPASSDPDGLLEPKPAKADTVPDQPTNSDDRATPAQARS